MWVLYWSVEAVDYGPSIALLYVFSYDHELVAERIYLSSWNQLLRIQTRGKKIDGCVDNWNG